MFVLNTAASPDTTGEADLPSHLAAGTRVSLPQC